ncbi:MAG TPA: matrixin family metalloprotease [Polyangiaceae bacterium]|nr:matrixin family metalloprotease [Polyangiaceae bacterium]
MIRTARLFASLSFCFALTALSSSTAFAFCRTNSCDPARGEVCSLDETGCRVGGVDLYWANSCVTFAVQRDGSKRNGIDAQSFEQVISNAFDTWMAADCGGGGHPSISVSSLGEVECSEVEYTKGANANIYMFRDDEWLASGPGNALALTTVWYDWHTGKIYDADTEVNGSVGSVEPGTDGYQSRITNSAPEDGADLPSIITHESGHFLGLDHTHFHEDATMNANYNPGGHNLRVLTQDDMDGICAVYPVDRQPEGDDCNPRHGFSGSCYVPESGGCSLGARGLGGSTWFGVTAGLGLASLFVARRTRRRRQ